MVQRISVHNNLPRKDAPSGEEIPGRWSVLTASPHRVMFLLGVSQIVLAMLWWIADLSGRYAGWYAAPQWSVPPLYAHAFLMIYAVFPLFVFGFAMTAMPNWTKGTVRRASWVTTGILFAVGIVLLYVGLFVDTYLVGLGVLVFLGAWLTGWSALLKLVIGNRAKDKHALGIVSVLAIGAVGVSLFAISLFTGDWLYADFARRMGIWLFLLPLFMVVSHRLVPFFSSRIIQNYVMYRPTGSLALLFVGCGGHFLLDWFGLYGWTWLVDFPMAIWVAYLALRWGLAHSFRARLLAMLHTSLVALAVGLALYGLASLLALLGYPGVLGYAPLHALAIGYFAAKTLGMVSRVSLGHSGRALEADPITWRCFQAVLLVAFVRVLSELSFVPQGLRTVLLIFSAVGWLAVFIPWSLSYAPIYLRPRADGKAG